MEYRSFGRTGVKVSPLCLGWMMFGGKTEPADSYAIIGPRTMEPLVDNLGAMDVAIDDEDCVALDRLTTPGSVISPCYNADFGPHQFRW